MTKKEIYLKYQKKIKEYPEKYYQDYLLARERVRESTAYYHGNPVDFLYQPLFFSQQEYENLRETISTFIAILKKVVAEYRKNPTFRRHFHFPSLMEELVLINPGYKNVFPIARFDLFYNKKFCELNTDGSSAMNEVRVLQQVLSKTSAFKEITADIATEGFELFDSLIDSILKNYREFNDGVDDQPNIAILDFNGEGTIAEFKEFQKRFLARGYQTVICDPRELTYSNKKLFFKDLELKLIYRRATTVRLFEEADSIGDFLQAYRDGNVCVVGGLVSQIIHNKIIFAVLYDRKKVPFLTEEEYSFIKKYIPRTELFDCENRETFREITANKDNFILKPTDGAAASGVYCGRDFTDREWQGLLKKIENDDYLIQEFIEIPQIKLPTAENTGFGYEHYGFLLGLFLYNQQLTGLYTRAGRENIIGAAGETFTVPNFVYS